VGFPLQFIMGMTARREIRTRYSLEGSGYGDCLRTACCCWCALAQEEKEMVYRAQEKEATASEPQGYVTVKDKMEYSPKAGENGRT